jgi:hypothetical protein
MNTATSYVVGNKRARIAHVEIVNDNWAANRVAKFEMSRLPAGEDCIGLLLVCDMKIDQDGNGGDGIDRSLIPEIIANLNIADQFGKLIDLSGYQLAQLYKINTGHNPILPEDIAASSGASTVHNYAKFIIPIYFSQWNYIRPHDFAIPTLLLQDATLSIQWSGDIFAAAHASNSLISASCSVFSITAQLNRAVIPPTVEIGTLFSSSQTSQLSRGNYNSLFMTGISRDNFGAFTTLKMDADGTVLIDGLRIDQYVEFAALEKEFVDDDLQMAYNPLNLYASVISNDKNVPPTPSATYIAAASPRYFAPLYWGFGKMKLSQMIRVDNRLNTTILGTNHDKIFVYHRYRSHTSAELEAKARMLGFGPGTKMVTRTHRRKLTDNDAGLESLLPVRLVQASAVARS